MAVLQVLLATLFRSLGKLLNTAFGWATTVLFGKVPEKRQTLLSIAALASILWLVVTLGVLFPRLAAFLLAFVAPSSITEAGCVRLVMLGSALLLPAGVGILSLFSIGPEQRPSDFRGKFRVILKGYPYTLGLSLTLLMMIVLAPVMKLQDLLRGWTSAHVPMVVESEHYFTVVGDVQRVLEHAGLPTVQGQASWMLRLPTRLLTLLAGGSVENLVARQMVALRRDGLEVLLHPSDLILRGKERNVIRVNALVTEHLTFTSAYQTWSKEAQQLEDRLAVLWHQTRGTSGETAISDGMTRLRGIEHDLQSAEVSYEEREVLFREKLSVERALLRVQAGLADEVEEPGEERKQSGRARPVVSEVTWLLALAAAVLRWLVPQRDTQMRQ